MNNLSRNDIDHRVKKTIIERLTLRMKPEDIKSDAPIFLGSEVDGVKGLGLDSIDALELVVGLNEEFNITITDENMHIFQSVDKIVDFIIEQSKG